jgi:spoIIIJ-associated protein
MIMSNSIFVDNAKSYLEKMLAILDLEATVLEEELDENTTCYRIDCKPDDARILIGRNGQTLEALQFVVRQMCRNSGSEQKPFLIDILDYRSRRQRSLEGQGKRAAVAVLNGESEHIALPPMNAYERRAMHQYLQDNFPDLVTQSQGEGSDRHIVVSFKGATPQAEESREQTGSPESVEDPANTESS